MGSSICDFVTKSFALGNFNPIVNFTFVTLIPKIESMDSITHFRPISLCNVTYRTLTKFLVNRLLGLFFIA